MGGPEDASHRSEWAMSNIVTDYMYMMHFERNCGYQAREITQVRIVPSKAEHGHENPFNVKHISMFKARVLDSYE